MERKMLRIGVPIEVYGGTIHSAVADAIELSRRLGCLVTLEFNKTPVSVSPDSDPDEVVERYHRDFGRLEDDEDDVDDGDGVPDEANARLIAAAPDLLAACEAFLARTDLAGRWPCPDCGRGAPRHPRKAIELGNGNVIGCWLCQTDDLRAIARAAIAEATGSPPT